ncbi:MAG: DUF308 domain-containing protein [Rhodobacteraceae bacterium]|nr:DUF308 domain-containing protein [Paracoccaceae bacterium]
MTYDLEHSDNTEALRSHIDWRWLLVLGNFMILGGVLAFVFPFPASLAVETVAGITFLVAGAMQAWLALRASSSMGSERTMSALLGFGLMALAVLLLANPLAGLVSLTSAIAALFILFGLLRLAIGLGHTRSPSSGWMAAAGLVSLVLGALILMSLPSSALGLLGIFLGVDLISSGAVVTIMALEAKKLA